MVDNTYIFGNDSENDLPRVLIQSQILNKEVGLLPPTVEVNPYYEAILDIGTGPGPWCIEMALQLPDRQIFGIDINPRMIEYAQTLSQLKQLHNTHFQVVDVTHPPLPFEDNTFGIISARLITSFLNRETWPLLLRECWRILQPGGVLILNEVELQVTNSLALSKEIPIFWNIMYDLQRSFAPLGFGFGFAFKDLLREAAFTHIQVKPYLVDYSAGEESHDGFAADMKMGMSALQNFTHQHTGRSHQELDLAYQRIYNDFDDPNFKGVIYGVWGIGYKPFAQDSL